MKIEIIDTTGNRWYTVSYKTLPEFYEQIDVNDAIQVVPYGVKNPQTDWRLKTKHIVSYRIDN